MDLLWHQQAIANIKRNILSEERMILALIEYVRKAEDDLEVYEDQFKKAKEQGLEAFSREDLR